MKLRTAGRLLWTCSVLMLAVSACQGVAGSTTQNAPALAAVNTVQATTSPTVPQATVVAPGTLPAKRADEAKDANSSVDAAKKQAPTGDIFVSGLYERPFNANTMDTYFPFLDIVGTVGYKDVTWGYATISMSGPDASGHLSGKYGVELDLNKDGRGEWLILATSPTSTDWTRQGVQAWKDGNGDVGGKVPLTSDGTASGGDGYETLVFDQGKNGNTDGAWVRIDPSDPNTVMLAFKLTMLGGPKSYAMGAWAGTDALNPAIFDLNDYMTHAQAGSPILGDQWYPIRQLAEIDNTCRLAIDYVATPKDPGMCSTFAPQPGEPEHPIPSD